MEVVSETRNGAHLKKDLDSGAQLMFSTRLLEENKQAQHVLAVYLGVIREKISYSWSIASI